MGYVAKRRLAILFFFLIFVFFISYLIYLKYFKVYPTCHDGIQNQGEEGVDCGGPCKKICTFKANDVNFEWTRAFEVMDGVYNIAALVSNPNFYYETEVGYVIRYINDLNVVIGEIKDKVTLKPLETKILFYPSINLKGQKIKRVYLYKKEILNIEQAKPEEQKIIVKDKEIVDDEDAGITKLRLDIQNTDVVPKNNISIAAVLLNDKGNVIDLNKTYYEHLDPNETTTIYLTWRRKIQDKVSEIRVYIDLDDVYNYILDNE